MDPKHFKWQGALAAIAAFFVVNLVATSIGVYAAFYPGLIAGALIFLFYNEIVGRKRSDLDNPVPAAYALPRKAVLGVLKEVVPNLNVDDRWWILHWMNQEKGQMKFRVNYETSTGRQNEVAKQQVILDAYLNDLPNGKTLVRLRYTVSPQNNREHADGLIQHTTESIHYQLEITEKGKQG